MAALVVIGGTCALNVGRRWALLNHLAPELATGDFRVRVVSDWIKGSRVRFTLMTEKG